MRLLNQDSDIAFSRLLLLLTSAEASELRDKLESILRSGAGHEHVPSADFQKEIAVAIYDESNLDAFDDRSQRLITKDT